MKHLLLITLLMTYSMSIVSDSEKNKHIEVCKSYITQAKAYKATMGTDALAQETFAFYKDKVTIHCGDLSSKAKFERKSFSELMMKSNVKDKQACKLAIDIASKYSRSEHQSKIIIAAHKENIADKCGTLMAGHVSNYCLYGEDK